MRDPFDIYQKIHFIGIGGIGISALARLLKEQGHQISGSDQTKSHNIDLLLEEGMKIIIGHTADSIPQDSQLVIHTTAIPKDNPELQTANNMGVPVISYPQAVGKLTEEYNTICVCGTHGKTTITALLGETLAKLDRSPTIIVGSLAKAFNNKNYVLGTSDLLVVESCEYQEAFLNYSPRIIILNNIDPEHLDYFHTSDNYLNAFRKFINKLPAEGVLIANGDDENIKTLISEKNYPFKILLFGKNRDNSYRLNQNQVHLPDGETLELKLTIPGDHNLLNATAALTACQVLGLSPSLTVPHLNAFQGTARRLELKGHINGIPLIDDYGHAPAEIRASLSALKSQYGETTKILCIFQPHQYSRTYYFLNEFAQSFGDAKTVYIPNIYRSRDSSEDIAKVSVDALVSAINTFRPKTARNTVDFATTLELVQKNHQDYDLILTIGAGDITRLGTQILARSINSPS